jgi:hypothetical protein
MWSAYNTLNNVVLCHCGGIACQISVLYSFSQYLFFVYVTFS